MAFTLNVIFISLCYFIVLGVKISNILIIIHTRMLEEMQATQNSCLQSYNNTLFEVTPAIVTLSLRPYKTVLHPKAFWSAVLLLFDAQ